MRVAGLGQDRGGSKDLQEDPDDLAGIAAAAAGPVTTHLMEG
jgi:hypothetical protein